MTDAGVIAVGLLSGGVAACAGWLYRGFQLRHVPPAEETAYLEREKERTNPNACLVGAWRYKLLPELQTLRNGPPHTLNTVEAAIELVEESIEALEATLPTSVAIQNVELRPLMSSVTRQLPVDSLWSGPVPKVWADPQRLSKTLSWALDEVLNKAKRATIQVDAGPVITLTIWPTDMTRLGAVSPRFTSRLPISADPGHLGNRATVERCWMELQGGTLVQASIDDGKPVIVLTLQGVMDPEACAIPASSEA